VFAAINLTAFVWHLILFFRYRPAAACSNKKLPRCTVVVPAFNEGRQVLDTLRSLAASNYPANKLDIIAVDDGSADDTWYWICAAEKELRGRMTSIQLPKNRGKRRALEAGFSRATGDVLVTVDSDSIVEADTLRLLVSPIVRDSRVGAVAGNVRVLNRHEGIIPRMLDVLFVFSFDFIRAGQSELDTVMCTPGALSAYRRDIVARVLPEWIDQTFFGRPANIGEDRAMTNLILREGYHVTFQQNATVWTNVPTHYKNLCKMFLRWARSNIRETLAMCRFAFRRFRCSSMLGARINLLLQLLSMTKSQVLLVVTYFVLATHPSVLGLHTLTSIIVASMPTALLYFWRCKSSEGLWAFAYGIFWFFGLFWITPYALATPHRSGWLTRQTPVSIQAAS
jgi:hyaluronan synthase